MQVFQTPTFTKQTKKLHTNQKTELDCAIKKILADPSIGELKKGDLAGIQVFKFKMVGQLTLLAYRIEYDKLCLILLALGVHENFYRDLKT